MALDSASVLRSVQCFFQPLQSVYSSRDCKVDFKLRGGGRPTPPTPPWLRACATLQLFLKMAVQQLCLYFCWLQYFWRCVLVF